MVRFQHAKCAGRCCSEHHPNQNVSFSVFPSIFRNAVSPADGVLNSRGSPLSRHRQVGVRAIALEQAAVDARFVRPMSSPR